MLPQASIARAEIALKDVIRRGKGPFGFAWYGLADRVEKGEELVDVAAYSAMLFIRLINDADPVDAVADLEGLEQATAIRILARDSPSGPPIGKLMLPPEPIEGDTD